MHTHPSAGRTSWLTPLCVLCAAVLPGIETYALLHRSAPLAAVAEYHLLSAGALLILLLLLGRQLSVWHRATFAVAALLDVAIQWQSGAEYVMLSVLQPAHIIVLWGIVRMSQVERPQDGTAWQLVRVATPLLLLWGSGAVWSPFVTTPPESYTGGERLISLGMTTLLGCVATLVYTLLRWQRSGASPVAWVGAIAVFAVQQAWLAESVRFVPVIVLAGLIPMFILRLQSAARLLASASLAIVLSGGVMLTVRLTSLLAWNITLWFGALVLCLLGAVALAAFDRPTAVEAQP